MLTTFHWDAQGFSTLPGTIRVVKVTQPATSNLSFNFVLTGKNVTRNFVLSHNEVRAFRTLNPDSYQLTESVPAGWSQASATCSDGSPVTAITLSAEETVTCTFTNVQLGTIIVKTITEPSLDNTTAFTFTTAGGLSPATFTLTGGGTRTLENVVPRSGYRIIEALPAGWIQRSASCSDGSPLENLTISPGETVTCTFTNTQLGTLVVRKSTAPSPDRTTADFSFLAGGGLTPSSFTLKDGQSRRFVNLQPKSGYSISETPTADWELTSASCDNNSPITNLTIAAGQTVICTFTNRATRVELALQKSDGNFVAEAGDTIVYQLTYRNLGNQQADGVVLTEQVPANTIFAGPADQWNCPLGAPAGTTCTATIGTLVSASEPGTTQFRVTVNSALPANITQIENLAYIGYNGNATAAQSSDTTPLEIKGGLQLSKDDGGSSATPNGIVTYQLSYHNEAPQTVLGVVISETVPAQSTFVGPREQWDCPVGSTAGVTCRHQIPTLLGQATGNVTFQVQVAATLPAEVDALVNRAVIGSLLNPHADEGVDRTEITVSPDLSLAVSDNDVTVEPGAVLRYRLSYLNRSARGALGVQLTATLPPNTQLTPASSSAGWQCRDRLCTYVVGSLPSGSGNGVDLALTVARPLPAGTTTLLLQTRIDDNGQNGTDPTPQNNLATVETSVVAPVNLSATKRASLAIDRNSDGKAGPGDTIAYEIVVRNDGGLGLRQLVLTDELDAHVELLDGAISSQGTVSSTLQGESTQLLADLGNLAGAGESATLRFRVQVDQPLAAGVTAVQNQATLRSPDFPDRLTDDPETTAVGDATRTELHAVVQLRADLNDFLFIDADTNVTVSAGDTLIYELMVQNVGEVNSGPLAVTIPLDPNVALALGTVTTSRGVVTGGNESDEAVAIAIDDLPVGATALVTFQVRLVSAAAEVIQHQASISYRGVGGQATIGSDDPDTPNVVDATQTPLGSKAPLRFVYLPLIDR